MDEAPRVRLCDVYGHQGKKNDVVFCGTEAQQHVVYFHGDVQVSINVILFSHPNDSRRHSGIFINIC